jgi:hypothetical protein
MLVALLTGFVNSINTGYSTACDVVPSGCPRPATESGTLSALLHDGHTARYGRECARVAPESPLCPDDLRKRGSQLGPEALRRGRVAGPALARAARRPSPAGAPDLAGHGPAAEGSRSAWIRRWRCLARAMAAVPAVEAYVRGSPDGPARLMASWGWNGRGGLLLAYQEPGSRAPMTGGHQLPEWMREAPRLTPERPGVDLTLAPPGRRFSATAMSPTTKGMTPPA